MMKKRFLLVFSLLVLLSVLLYFVLPMKDSTTNTTQPTPTPIASCPNFIILDPQPGDTVTAPFTVTATVDNTKSKNCNWAVFEAQAGAMTLTDSSGAIIGEGVLTTTSDWMTDEAVQYTGTVTFTETPEANDLTLTITEEDPSGEGDIQTISIPLQY